MNAQSPDTINVKFRALLILWFASISSVGVFALISLMLLTGGSGEAGTFPLIMVCLGALSAIISFPIKSRMLRATERTQNVDGVLRAYTVAFALCEVAGLLAVVVRGRFGPGYFVYLLFGIAFAGLLAHMPKRDHMLAATYRDAS